MTAISTIISTLSLLALYAGIDILFSRKVFWVKNAAFAVFSFFGTFIIVSGALFAFDAYSFWLTYGLCFAIGFGAAAGIAGYNIRKTEHRGSLISYVKSLERVKHSPRHFVHCLAGLLIAGIIVSCAKYEHYGMGQDQGVYQAAAMYRTAGLDSVQIDLPGYHALTSDSDRALFLDIMRITRTSVTEVQENRTLLGFYMNDYDIRLNFEPSSEVSGVLHGIPNFGALLSISGRVFGISGMSHLNTLFLLAGVCLLFLTLNYNFKLKISTSTLITALFIISPITIWTSKAALTECFLTLVIVAFIYLATSSERHTRWLLWLPVAVFAFFHVSIYTMMPMFVIVFIVMYMHKRDMGIFFSGLVSLAAYFAGFCMMTYAANGYTMGNYMGPLRPVIDFLNLDYRGFLMFVYIVTFVAVVFFALSCYIIRKRNIGLNSEIFIAACKYLTLLLLALAILPWTIEYFHDRLPPEYLQIRRFVSRLPHRTIFSYTLLSGFIVLPIVLYGLIFKREKFSANNTAPLTLMFLYCILAYSAFLRQNTPYFYYYGRYLAPFIPIILVLAGVYLDSFEVRKKAAVFAISVALTFPFTVFVTINKDHSRVDWNSFEQVAGAVNQLSEDDIVIVSEEAVKFFFLPLSAMTDSIILPGDNYGRGYNIVEDKINNPGSGAVYLLSMNGADGEYEGYWREDSIAFNARGSECTNLPGLIPPLPLEMRKTEFNIYLTEMNGSLG